MHGSHEITQLPRMAWTMVHLVFVLAVAWLYFGGGISVVGNWFGQSWYPGDPSRRLLLMAFGITLWMRMSFTAFVLLKRRFEWTECIAVIGAVAFYQFGFALLGATSLAPLSAIDLIAAGLFILGSYLNTGSEIQRKKFKTNSFNNGKLYSGGLFSVVRHPNYLGDILWALGWAAATRNIWAVLISLVAAVGFVFLFIPQLSAYLSKQYGEQYEDWARRTKRLIPFVY
jgi:protein-S-isoprenylcysteine O-methyltransferase Ste14